MNFNQGTPKYNTTGAEELSEQEKENLIQELGGQLHTEWQETYRKQNPEVKSRIKTTKDEKWIKENNVQPNADGKFEVDILNTDYEDLPEDWKGENKKSAEVAMGSVFSWLEKKGSNGLDGEEFLEKASEWMHIKWLERNGSWAPEEQKKDYKDLSEEEKEKDRVIIRKAVSLYKKSLSNSKE